MATCRPFGFLLANDIRTSRGMCSSSMFIYNIGTYILRLNLSPAGSFAFPTSIIMSPNWCFEGEMDTVANPSLIAPQGCIAQVRQLLCQRRFDMLNRIPYQYAACNTNYSDAKTIQYSPDSQQVSIVLLSHQCMSHVKSINANVDCPRARRHRRGFWQRWPFAAYSPGPGGFPKSCFHTACQTPYA
jgi:hypothetical protein